MMEIDVEANPNCPASGQFVFREIAPPRPIRGIRIEDRGKEIDCDVTAVDEGGVFGRAFSVKVADSGSGFAFLIYGGKWGIRIRRVANADEAWDLSNRHQWGEPFKMYGDLRDILF
ncbi:MAG: hypothetical protein HYZ52_00590 [Candidatus Omnitrophica bacterium]|nr:hypothetical protein [Candidatus Omnitrophota bacterium]